MNENADSETDPEAEDVRDRLQERADRAADEFDERLIDLLSWVLDTETRGRIFIYLRANPESTSDEIADGTGLYPSTVREALAELHEEDIATRTKREHEGAGNNPYEYSAMAPSDLMGDLVGEIQDQLNTIVNLDAHLHDRDEETDEPITISVSDPEEDEGESA